MVGVGDASTNPEVVLGRWEASSVLASWVANSVVAVEASCAVTAQVLLDLREWGMVAKDMVWGKAQAVQQVQVLGEELAKLLSQRDPGCLVELLDLAAALRLEQRYLGRPVVGPAVHLDLGLVLAEDLVKHLWDDAQDGVQGDADRVQECLAVEVGWVS